MSFHKKIRSFSEKNFIFLFFRKILPYFVTHILFFLLRTTISTEIFSIVAYLTKLIRIFGCFFIAPPNIAIARYEKRVLEKLGFKTVK